MDRAERRAAAAVVIAGIAVGLWGIRWGLPGSARFRAFPERMAMTPETARRFTDSWKKMYEGIVSAHQGMRDEPDVEIKGVEEVPPGWDFPPDVLINSYRSLLIQSEHPDEKKSFIILSHMHPRRLDFKPLYVFYGGSFIYPLGLFLQISAWLRTIVLVPGLEHYLQHPEDMAGLYLCGRAFMLIFNVGTLWLLFDLGRRLSGPRTGVLAALFFGLCPIAVVNSHIIKPHPYAAFWCLATARYALIALETGALRAYALSGLCCGLAGGANFSFACFAWLPVLAGVQRWRAGSAAAAELRGILYAAAGAAGVFVVTNPYLVFSPRQFLWDFSLYVPHGGAGWSWAGLVSLLGDASAASMGPPLYACALIGTAAALWRGGARRFLALAVAGTFAILWLAFGRVYSFGVSGIGIRYYYPLFPMACVLAADGLESLRGRRWIPAALAAAILVDTGMRGLVYSVNMSADSGPRSTRAAAADWIEAHVPPGASVGLPRYPAPPYTPRFRYDKYRLVVFQSPESLDPARLPEYIVLDAEAQQTMASSLSARYGIAAAFDPIRLGWARATDPGFFANTGVFVYRRKDS